MWTQLLWIKWITLLITLLCAIKMWKMPHIAVDNSVSNYKIFHQNYTHFKNKLYKNVEKTSGRHLKFPYYHHIM